MQVPCYEYREFHRLEYRHIAKFHLTIKSQKKSIGIKHIIYERLDTANINHTYFKSLPI